MKKYGLIGYPVKHSLSPVMHNAAFKHLGIEAEYVLFEVRPNGLKDFFSRFKETVCGANITIPHKEAALEYVDKRSALADSIGAVNTVVIENGLLAGHNTDIAGFVKALTGDLDFKPDDSKRVLILGAGGASRAVAFGLKSLNIKEIVLTDLDAKKAAVLAGDLNMKGCNAAAIEYNKKTVGELAYNSDLVVNATPCGMKEGDAELFDLKFLHEGLSVFDLIYNPKETQLLKEAKKRGCAAVNGLGMLLYQGAEAFELWTGRRAPVDVMRTALKSALYG